MGKNQNARKLHPSVTSLVEGQESPEEQGRLGWRRGGLAQSSIGGYNGTAARMKGDPVPSATEPGSVPGQG